MFAAVFGGALHGGNRYLACLGNLDRHRRLAAVAAASLDGSDDIHAFNDLAEHDVLVVEVRGGNSGDEELRKGSEEEQLETTAHCCAITWLPLVLGPAFAMDKSPGVSCLSLKFSSENFSP